MFYVFIGYNTAFIYKYCDSEKILANETLLAPRRPLFTPLEGLCSNFKALQCSYMLRSKTLLQKIVWISKYCSTIPKTLVFIFSGLHELCNIDFTNPLKCTLKACLLIGALWLGVCTVWNYIWCPSAQKETWRHQRYFLKYWKYMCIWVILRCWGNSSILCQQNSDAL